MFANLNYLLLIVLIVLKKHLADGQESHEQNSYEDMDSREQQLYRSKNGGFTEDELNDPLGSASKSNSPTPAPDDESSFENQMPQQATKKGKENHQNIPNNHHVDNPAFPHPVFNPYLTFNPYRNPYMNHENPLSMFRQVSPFMPMQAQASYGSYDNQLPGYPPPGYQPPGFHQPPMFNPLLYPPMMYGQQMQHLPFANHGDQLGGLFASNQPIITYTPIDEKMIEHVPYNDRSFGRQRAKKSHSRKLDEHSTLYPFDQ